MGEHLRRTDQLSLIGTGERFGRDEFLARVADRSGADLPQAAYLCRAVLEVIDEATGGGVMDRVREALPADIRPFATAGSTGTMRD